MSSDSKPPDSNDSADRRQAILDGFNNPAHYKNLGLPGGPRGGAARVGMSFSVDAPGAVCDRRHALVAPPADGAPLRQSESRESIRGQQGGHWLEVRAPHARMLTGHDAQGNVWSIQFHRGWWPCRELHRTLWGHTFRCHAPSRRGSDRCRHLPGLPQGRRSGGQQLHSQGLRDGRGEQLAE